MGKEEEGNTPSLHVQTMTLICTRLSVISKQNLVKRWAKDYFFSKQNSKRKKKKHKTITIIKAQITFRNEQKKI